MDDPAYGLIELLLVFGAAIVWALWEIRSTSRSDRDGAQAQAGDKPGEAGREP